MFALMFAPRKASIFLIVIAIGLLVAELGWFLLRRKDVKDFLLETTQAVLLTDDLASIPVFDAGKRHWLKEEKHLPSIIPLLHDSDPERIGPDGIGMYAAVRLSGQSGAQVARQALLLLSSEGVCQVAIFSSSTNRPTSRFDEAPVVRLIYVRSDDGQIRLCVDHVNNNR